MLNFLNDRFGNYIINKYLNITGVYEGTTTFEVDDSLLFYLIGSSDVVQIKKLNYGLNSNA